MFKVMVTRWHSARPYLGVGTYYRKPDSDNETGHGEWVAVNLKQPLLLDGRQVRMLIEKYGTDSRDDMTALAGAWTLRRELLHMGHDGIVAIEPEEYEAAHGERHMIVVDLAPHTAHDEGVTNLPPRIRHGEISVERVHPSPEGGAKNCVNSRPRLEICPDYGETSSR